MNPKKQILKYIQNAYADTNQPGDVEKRGTSASNDIRNEDLQELFDGMSSGTARIIIEQEVNRYFKENFGIDLVKIKAGIIWFSSSFMTVPSSNACWWTNRLEPFAW